MFWSRKSDDNGLENTRRRLRADSVHLVTDLEKRGLRLHQTAELASLKRVNEPIFNTLFHHRRRLKEAVNRTWVYHALQKADFLYLNAKRLSFLEDFVGRPCEDIDARFEIVNTLSASLSPADLPLAYHLLRNFSLGAARAGLFDFVFRTVVPTDEELKVFLGDDELTFNCLFWMRQHNCGSKELFESYSGHPDEDIRNLSKSLF